MRPNGGRRIGGDGFPQFVIKPSPSLLGCRNKLGVSPPICLPAALVSWAFLRPRKAQGPWRLRGWGATGKVDLLCRTGPNSLDTAGKNVGQGLGRA